MNQRLFFAVSLLIALPLSRGEDRALADTIRVNPTLKAAHARRETVKVRVPQAAAREDLRIDALVGRSPTSTITSAIKKTARKK